MTDNRYSAIESVADLGGLEMFPDRTPDLTAEENPRLQPGAMSTTNHHEGS